MYPAVQSPKVGKTSGICQLQAMKRTENLVVAVYNPVYTVHTYGSVHSHVSELWYISGKNHCQASFQGHIRLYQFLHRNFGCTKGIGAVAQLEQFRDVIASLLRNHTQTANNHNFFCMFVCLDLYASCACSTWQYDGHT